MNEITLLEPSVADAIKAIEAAVGLSASKRTHWSCSLRQICAYLNRPVEAVPARWSAINRPVHDLHAARVGANPKTLANHKANGRNALQWFGEEKDLPKRGAPLLPAWAALMSQIEDHNHRKQLSSLARYCSAAGIDPESVNEEVLDKYMRYRGETTRLEVKAAARRRIARAWNECGDWPKRRLIEPPIKEHTETAWECFPETLRQGIEDYLAGLREIRRSFCGRRARPCKATTITARRRELQAFARMAVRLGRPIESLTSLNVLLQPDLVQDVLNAYWEQNGEEPTVYTIDLAWKLLSIARATKSLGESDLAQLDETRAAMEEHRHGGLTEKNLKVIRAVRTDGVWDKVVQLPEALMAEARLIQSQSPVKAAVTAQLAIAIAILCYAPIRLGNLIRIRLGENLIKPAGLNGPYWLVFPHYEVKNRVPLEFKLQLDVCEIIDEYIRSFRPSLLRGSNDTWLFPGEKTVKTSNTLSSQITERIEKATGLRVTVHQFRHAAAAIFLKQRPGQYEAVRRFLGHKNIQTTISFYIGLDTIQASEMLGEIVQQRLRNREEQSDDE